jgi:hypothetical protein
MYSNSMMDKIVTPSPTMMFAEQVKWAKSGDCEPKSDPFYDRFPWFRIVGRSFVYLR